MKRFSATFYFGSSAALFIIFALFGFYVTHHGEPPALLAFALAVRGKAIGAAWILTQFGWLQGFGGFFLAAIAVAVFSRSWRARMLYLMASCLIAWGVTDWLQHVFARPRRADWLLRHEHAFSYPSSHASTCTAFYLLAAVLLLTSELPALVRYGSFAVLAALWAGICWSRLALAAHYPTDVAGGILLGAAISLAGAGVMRLAGKTPARV